MRDRAERRPIPVERSIHWKPLRDSHYVVASLQPGDGGRRQIFISQDVLSRIQALVRANGSREIGLTLGQFYHCPVTGVDYLVIESIAEIEARGHGTEIEATVSEALADRHLKRRGHVVGWYWGVTTVEPKPSRDATAVHTSLFEQPWQSTLLVSEAGGTSGGAFWLHDTSNARWFHAPFYELNDRAPALIQPKPTVVTWPNYMTTDSVVLATLERSLVAESADAPVKRRDSRDVDRTSRETIDEVERPERGDRPADPPGTRKPLRSLADLPDADPGPPIPRRRGRSSDKRSIADDRVQTSVASAGRPVGDAEDTTLETDPARYIELARSEGFFIAARFETKSELNRRETLWILNEPYSGLLLAVVTTETAVVDATLHYNLQTDDVGLRKVPFPEHRDPESKTIYGREACLESLRARCRRLRATNSLLQEWKVTPAISFVTPGEWESVAPLDAGIDRGLSTVNEINVARIAELPAGVRSQFHIDAPRGKA